jgi:hypothetical protein
VAALPARLVLGIAGIILQRSEVTRRRKGATLPIFILLRRVVMNQMGLVLQLNRRGVVQNILKIVKRKSAVGISGAVFRQAKLICRIGGNSGYLTVFRRNHEE